MNMKAKRSLILILCIVTIFCGGILFCSERPPHGKGQAQDLKLFKEIFPALTRVERDTEKPVYGAYSNDEKIGLLFFTKETAPDIQGFTGPINILVGIDLQGTIQGLKVIKHAETHEYVDDLNAFVQQFISLGTSSHLEVGKDIDGITGATITSEAIARSIKESLAVLFKAPQPDDSQAPSRVKKQIENAGLSMKEASFWKEVK